MPQLSDDPPSGVFSRNTPFLAIGSRPGRWWKGAGGGFTLGGLEFRSQFGKHSQMGWFGSKLEPSDLFFGVEKPCLAGVPKNRTTAEFLQDFHSKQLHHNCCWQVHFSQHVIYPLFSDGTSVDETVRWLLAVVGCVLRDKRGTIILWKCRPTSLLGASYL